MVWADKLWLQFHNFFFSTKLGMSSVMIPSQYKYIYIYIYIYIYTHTHTIHKLQMFSKFSKKIYKMNDIVHFEPNMFAQL